MQWIWLGVIISLILIELVSLNFASIWFAISAILSFVLLKLEYNYGIQVGVFLVVGILFILIVRPKIIGRLIKKRNYILNKLVEKNRLFKLLIPKNIDIFENKNDNNKKRQGKKNKAVKR